jgi:hypothetical protein
MAYCSFWGAVFLAEAVVTLFLWCQFLYTNVKLCASWSTSVATMRKTFTDVRVVKVLQTFVCFVENWQTCSRQLPYWRYRCQFAMPVSLCLFCSVRSRTACRKTVCLIVFFHFCVYVNFSVIISLGPCQLCTAVQESGAWPTFLSVSEPSLLNFQYKYMIYLCNADCCTQLKRVNLNTVEIFYILTPPPPPWCNSH